MEFIKKKLSPEREQEVFILCEKRFFTRTKFKIQNIAWHLQAPALPFIWVYFISWRFLALSEFLFCLRKYDFFCHLPSGRILYDPFSSIGIASNRLYQDFNFAHIWQFKIYNLHIIYTTLIIDNLSCGFYNSSPIYE